MDINFDKGEYIILGLKDEEGNLYSYSNSGGSKEIMKVTLGENAIISEFSVFPFDTFTTLDDEKTGDYKRTYLRVKLKNNLSTNQIDSLCTNGIIYYKFGEREVKIVDEFTKPFEYALAVHKDIPDRFGVYNAMTWLIHEKPFSEKEELFMKLLIDSAIKYYDNYESKYTFGGMRLSLTPSREMLRYVSHIRDSEYDKKVDIEGYYRKGLMGRDIFRMAKANKFTLEDAFFMISKANNIFPYLHHPEMTASKLRDAIENENVLEDSSLLYRDEYLKDLSETDFDMVELFEIYYDFIMKESHAEHYLTNSHLVEDYNYIPTEEEYNPYEYYCCPDCDGYQIDWDEFEISYFTKDEQVEFLHTLLRPWIGIIDSKSLYLFKNWAPEIFTRALKEDFNREFIDYVKLLNKN